MPGQLSRTCDPPPDALSPPSSNPPKWEGRRWTPSQLRREVQHKYGIFIRHGALKGYQDYGLVQTTRGGGEPPQWPPKPEPVGRAEPEKGIRAPSWQEPWWRGQRTVRTTDGQYETYLLIQPERLVEAHRLGETVRPLARRALRLQNRPECPIPTAGLLAAMRYVAETMPQPERKMARIRTASRHWAEHVRQHAAPSPTPNEEEAWRPHLRPWWSRLLERAHQAGRFRVEADAAYWAVNRALPFFGVGPEEEPARAGDRTALRFEELITLVTVYRVAAQLGEWRR
jgi:hypothetical protein